DVEVGLVGVTERLSTAEVEIDGLNGAIALKASTEVTNALGTRMSSAEINLSSLNGSISSKVSYQDYNGSTIASLINQSASTITLDAQVINLNGITNVASHLWLGTPGSTEEKGIYFR